jgi:hypothetical protein
MTSTPLAGPTPFRAARVTSSTILTAGALIMVALVIPTFAALVIDDRTLEGANIWDKPLKFQLSLMIYLVTLALLVQLIAATTRDGVFARLLAVVAMVAAAGEAFYITLQAARGRASHFNFETETEMVLYQLMGLGAVLLVVCAFSIGVLIWRAPREGLSPGLKLGSIVGLTLGGALTLAIAGLMSTGAIDGPGHWVGGEHSDARGLAGFGWSTTGGDLRVPHFFATHLMQALPLLGLFADKVAPRTAHTVVYIGIALSLLVVAATFAQAISGQPLFVP